VLIARKPVAHARDGFDGNRRRLLLDPADYRVDCFERSSFGRRPDVNIEDDFSRAKEESCPRQ